MGTQSSKTPSNESKNESASHVHETESKTVPSVATNKSPVNNDAICPIDLTTKTPPNISPLPALGSTEAVTNMSNNNNNNKETKQNISQETQDQSVLQRYGRSIQSFGSYFRQCKACGVMIKIQSLEQHSKRCSSSDIEQQMKKLNISNTYSKAYNATPISILKGRTTTIQLENCIQEIPWGKIFDTTNVSSLYLVADNIKILPPLIASLQELQALNLKYNSLTFLPPEIGLLRKLRMIDVSYNNLETLPVSFAQLQSLRLLDIQQNQFKALPPSFGIMKNLQVLEYQGNPIQWPPVEVLEKSVSEILTYLRNFGFKNSLNSPDYIDVTFRSEGHPAISAHRVLLATTCPSFANYFHPEQATEEITIPSEKYFAYSMIIQYLYVGSIEFPSEKLSLVKNLAKELKLHDLEAGLAPLPSNPTQCYYSGDGFSDLGRALENPVYSDITFLVEDRKIHCHKIVLTARSEFFARMFLSGMMESKQETISMDDIAYPTFNLVLQSLYKHQSFTLPASVTSDAQTLVDLLQASHYFSVESLKWLCENSLLPFLDAENCLTLFTVGNMFEAHQLEHKAAQLIKLHLAKMSRTEEYRNLTAEQKSIIQQVNAH